MFRSVTSRAIGLAFLSVLSTLGVLAAQERASDKGDKGDSAAERRLRGRSAAPKATEIDSTATLDSMLVKKDKSAFSEEKGATVDGYVIQGEREEDGDYHLTLASAAGETDTRKWVIVEVTPAWQQKSLSLSLASLRKLYGKKIRVTGWLYYEPDDDQPDPRGTRWEIHPVTELVPAK